MNEVSFIGENGLITLPVMMIVIGLMIFIFCYKYSVGIFTWIENQTFGTRTYILEKLELLFMEVNPDRLTMILLFLSLGLGTLSLIFFGFTVSWVLGFFVAIIMCVIGFKIPKPFIDYLVERRMKEYQGQMVDALTLLANGLRAGLSVPQALGMVVDELPEPISQEFNLILQQNRVGVPLEECFENLVKRVPVEDNEMFVSSINILRETGGNLAEVFDTIVDVIRERVRLQQKIDTYTAQGMFQGMTLFAMPFAVGGIYAATDPESMVTVFTNPLGIIAVILAVVMDLVGLFVIFKIVKIKV